MKYRNMCEVCSIRREIEQSSKEKCVHRLSNQTLVVPSSVLSTRMIIMSMNRTLNPNIISLGLISRVPNLNSWYPCQNVVIKVQLIRKKIESIMQCKHFVLQSAYCTQRFCNYPRCFLELAFVLQAKSQNGRVFILLINTNSATSFL